MNSTGKVQVHIEPSALTIQLGKEAGRFMINDWTHSIFNSRRRQGRPCLCFRGVCLFAATEAGAQATTSNRCRDLPFQGSPIRRKRQLESMTRSQAVSRQRQGGPGDHDDAGWEDDCLLQEEAARDASKAGRCSSGRQSGSRSRRSRTSLWSPAMPTSTHSGRDKSTCSGTQTATPTTALST